MTKRLRAPAVLFLGGDSEAASTPSGGLARALKRWDMDARFVVAEEYTDTGTWLALCRGVAAIVVVSYDGPNDILLRQLALATLLYGTPVIRWWVGTDVLNSVSEAAVSKRAKTLNAFSSENVAVAQHLTDELRAIGIGAKVIPSLSEFDPALVPDPTAMPPQAILVYLPTSRRDFYGLRFVEHAVRQHPEVLFYILADDNHTLAMHGNVVSVGWVADMSEIWKSVGCILRMTAHDGLPRMILEGLVRAKYVIYRWPLDGCWQATNEAEVSAQILRFQRMTGANMDGVVAAKSLLTPPPVQRFAALLSTARRRQGIGNRLRAGYCVLKLTVRWKLARMFPHLFRRQMPPT